MTVNELIHRLQLVQDSGWGDKEVKVDAGQEKYMDIDDVAWIMTDTVIISAIEE